uniref:WRKY19-like zinc finger domain-containing protein n=1 Tax=Leptocylindrus danicus TaxID=163516 RepID=A0A7S2JR34_9STRA|mmetsp:Transcript_10582/g.15861  ORF Transcript_10582/g.15861 Transcript_10582/m.15861 type:complete len:536 (+) Transcript_10582:113-1720(+)
MLNYICHPNTRLQMALPQAPSVANNQGALMCYNGGSVVRRQHDNQFNKQYSGTTTTSTNHYHHQAVESSPLDSNSSETHLNALDTAQILQQLQRSSPSSNTTTAVEHSSNTLTSCSVRTMDGARKRNMNDNHNHHLLHPFKKSNTAMLGAVEPSSLYNHNQLNKKSSPRVTPPAIDLDLGLSFAPGTSSSLAEVSGVNTIAASASGVSNHVNYSSKASATAAATATATTTTTDQFNTTTHHLNHNHGLSFVDATAASAVNNTTAARGYVSNSTSPFLNMPPPASAPAPVQASAAVDFRPYTAHQLSSVAHPNVAAYIAGLKCGLVMSGIADSLPAPMLSVDVAVHPQPLLAKGDGDFMNSYQQLQQQASICKPTVATTTKNGKKIKICRMEGCPHAAAKRTPYCSKHSGPRKCEYDGCKKCAQGRTRFCIAHGGGRRCIHPLCTKGARDSKFCAAHGGGKRCTEADCTKSAVGGSNKCTAHGGGKRCQAEGCAKSAQSATSFCVKHGGGRKCCVDSCNKVARGRSQMCMVHGMGS